MVLQRNSAVKLWGWSGPSEEVKITPSWDGHTYTAKATRDARWELTLPTPEAGGPYELTFEASNTLVLRDILIGEVWICSGQSNMEWSANHGFNNAEAEVQNADHPNLRLFQIPKTTSPHPQDDCAAAWELCSPATMRDFSAVAYFFGRHLAQHLDVPVGLIQAAWGGTAAEVWTPREIIDGDEEFSRWDEVLATSSGWPRTPGIAYNAMIHPVINYKIAGAIWYQGESNTANPDTYRRLFPSMIESWRAAWGFPLPFYYVQIAPFRYGTPFVCARVQEAQLMSMRTPLTGMVVVSDIGNIYDIHPRNKQDVGRRLGNWALARTYGQRDVVYSGPIYQSHAVEGGEMVISFKHAEDGLLSADGPLTEFVLAGEDRIFYPAEAVIRGSQVAVTSKYVLEPVAARFGFHNLAEPNLLNQHGLPASSFRTDDWPILAKGVDISIRYRPEAEAYLVALTSDGANEIKYTTNGDPPGLFGLTYREPFYIQNECLLQARAYVDDVPSDYVQRKEIRLNKATFMPVTLEQRYAPGRAAGGDQALIDGETGTAFFNDGKWQGYQGDLGLVLDFGKRIEIENISLHALKDQNRNIFLPNKVVFEISNDGQRFNEVYRKPLFHAREEQVEIYDYQFTFKNPRKTRYVRVSAENMKKCPSWHKNAGGQAWMLFDEIIIE